MSTRHEAILMGCGSMSGTWLTALRDHYAERVEVVGLVDLHETAAAAKAKEFNLPGCQLGTSLESVLARTKADVVFNCTIPEAHVATCQEALAAGCHVLMEKPLAPTVAEGQELEKAARDAGKVLAVIQNRRYLPGAIQVRKILDEGLIGKVNALHVDFFLGPHFGGFRETMRHPLLHDMAIHTFDQCRFFTGASAQRVTCLEFNPAGSWFANGASATALFEMSGAILFSYRGSWCARGFPTAWAGAWRIQGEKGTLLWDGEDKIEAEFVSSPPEKPGFFDPVEKRSFPPASIDPAQREHAGNIGEFLDAIDCGRIPQTHAGDNLHSLAMVEAAIQSALQHQTIVLP